ncbi:hypothetical protein DCAR_0417488 [Daucus carota subsp. sativus]|uniref:DC1 domain-containing protein n=1 Tax=Daucus carota subsp. sativus TaxID=79200 RepID=A0A165YI88_DAUCS|nr:PREDICTED: uncharacterized protein LOC108217443 [Daucus carota subsp. sativus]WOG98147.1 hypothetical protein DCAR_0417488 [Daucus carota subsp. sativus]
MEYKHFSHHHKLKVHQITEGQTIRCSGCERLCQSTHVVGCSQCNFFLHTLCYSAERYVKKHSSDPQHPLVLIPKPTYCSGSFICNKCGETGSSFSYCCTLCEIDLHLHCAFLPLKASHNLHQHELQLTKYSEGQGQDEFCKVCSKLLSAKYSFYSCHACQFDAHIYCVVNEVKPLEGDHDASSASGTSSNTLTAEEMAVELYNLQLQMEMTNAFAQMIASFKPII